MKHNKYLDRISIILVLIGGICWGLIGAFGFDLIGSVFDGGAMAMSPLTRIIYVLVGLSALYRIFVWSQARK